ncbi:hypothetical protein H2198_005489 [Neophaeococcomyces mojaviensis]|uniref:Uncharacterized protein n=1 Tax=Neophaeococcomyces mojaviensis TaxID=3383035 RepID=A0ACC3A625_9EURO|nr:hypothetical protein H2198_005489 [Knufia sp. JES_112]
MRLINTETLEFEEFEGDEDCPPWAILSHRWEDDEVTYQDAKISGLWYINKKGGGKIKLAARLALAASLNYVWVDTCCIDKNSSAELSEAINSMWSWYKRAEVCFAYLSDIEPGQENEFQFSLWFTRGWTLQELIAPHNVVFYNKEWSKLGTKLTLAKAITSRTKIPVEVLAQKVNLYTLPIAQRMAWARSRNCRRIEDTAYSLLGIFDVNMPLLYGEGKKAFKRLQEEIIKQTNDHTILLWTPTHAQGIGKLLAPSPDCFDHNIHFRFRPSRRIVKSYSVTNIGLSIALPLVPWYMNTYLALLDCEVAHEPSSAAVWRTPGLFLRRKGESNLFEKVIVGTRNFAFYDSAYSDRSSWKQIHDIYIALDNFSAAPDTAKIAQTTYGSWASMYLQDAQADRELYGFFIRSVDTAWQNLLRDSRILTEHSLSEYIVEMRSGSAGTALIILLPRYSLLPTAINAVKLGFDFDFKPCCVLGKVDDVIRDPFMFRGRDFDTAYQSTDLQDDASVKSLTSIDFTESRGWQSVDSAPVLLPSEAGCWIFKGDKLTGLSVLLGQENDLCVSQCKTRVRLTREKVKERITWVFDLHFSSCPGVYCGSAHQRHGQLEQQLSIEAPEITVQSP